VLPVSEQDYRRYVHVNLPHARTIVDRIGRSLEALGGFSEADADGSAARHAAFAALESAARPFDDDPPLPAALRAADAIAEHARDLVALVLATPVRGDRLGQNVRNLFECLGLADEGGTLALSCGERPDSPLR
jgi:hypothetical protein